MAASYCALPPNSLTIFAGFPKFAKSARDKNLNILNLGNALIHVLIQKDTQNRLRFGRILAEEVFFLHLAGPFFAGQRLLPYAT